MSKKNFTAYEELKAHIAKMRANGQPLNSAVEYRVWARAKRDYDAVLTFRKIKAYKKAWEQHNKNPAKHQKPLAINPNGEMQKALTAGKFMGEKV